MKRLFVVVLAVALALLVGCSAPLSEEEKQVSFSECVVFNSFGEFSYRSGDAEEVTHICLVHPTAVRDFSISGRFVVCHSVGGLASEADQTLTDASEGYILLWDNEIALHARPLGEGSVEMCSVDDERRLHK